MLKQRYRWAYDFKRNSSFQNWTTEQLSHQLCNGAISVFFSNPTQNISTSKADDHFHHFQEIEFSE